MLLFQDLAVAPLLFMVGALLTAGDSGLALAAARRRSRRPRSALAALVVFGRLALRPLFHSVADDQEPRVLHGRLPAGGARRGLAAAASRLSMALGAFIAGLLLAETEYRREIEVTIEPFKGLLLGLFFVSVGARAQSGVHRRAAAASCSGSPRRSSAAQGADALWARRGFRLPRGAGARSGAVCSGRAANSPS